MSFYSEDNISLLDEDSKNDNSLPYQPHSFRLDQNLVDSYYPINISSTDDLLYYPNTPLNFEDCIINNQYKQVAFIYSGGTTGSSNFNQNIPIENFNF